MTMIRNRAAQAMLRQIARDAIDAANWLCRYEATGNPEHRVNALRCLKEARDAAERVQVCVIEGIEHRAGVAS